MTILAQSKENLEHTGLLVLDAHKNFFDIFLTARNLRKELKPKVIVLPITGSFFYTPICKQLIKMWARIYGIDFRPVFRKVEYEPTTLTMKIMCSFYPKEMTPERRKQMNQEYVESTLVHAKTPGHVVLVSPYGGAIFHGGKVKYGVRKLMEVAEQAILSITRWDFRKMAFVTTWGKYNPDLTEGYRDIIRK